jgi:hypothetical protein
MIAAFVPLLADAEILKVIGFIIVALIWVFNHFVGAKGPQRRPPRADVRPRPPGAPAGRQEVNDEVAEFLRRTAERTAGKKRTEPEAAPPARQPLSERRLNRMPSGMEPVEAVAVDEPPEVSVAEHVQEFDSHLLSERPRRMTQMEQESRSFQAEVQHDFDHQLGRLAQHSPLAAEARQAAPNPAASIAALLADPENLRNVVVLNEILRRPTDRW